jgi:hypothetical protein
VAKVAHKLSREDCQRIAALIVELSGSVLSTVENKHHIALKIGNGNYSNAVIVVDSGYVKFFIPSEDLRKRVANEGFAPKRVKWPGHQVGVGFRFWGLSLNDIQAHGELFKALVQGSISEINHRKGQAGLK